MASTRRIQDVMRDDREKTPQSLLEEMHELIDMLSDDMLERAAQYILLVPEYPEDFDPGEISRLERAKADFRSGKLGQLSVAQPSERSVHESPAEYIGSTDETRENLHRLAESMSGEILDEAVDVMCSTGLLNIPYEPTEEELKMLAETDAEFERGEYYTWEEVKAEMFKETDV